MKTCMMLLFKIQALSLKLGQTLFKQHVQYTLQEQEPIALAPANFLLIVLDNRGTEGKAKIDTKFRTSTQI